MKNRIMALCLTGLILSTTPVSLFGAGNPFDHADPLFNSPTTKIGNMIKGYSVGLATGLVPPFIPFVGVCIIMGHAGSGKVTVNDAIFESSLAAGVLSGLYVWYSAISHWLK